MWYSRSLSWHPGRADGRVSVERTGIGLAVPIDQRYRAQADSPSISEQVLTWRAPSIDKNAMGTFQVFDDEVAACRVVIDARVSFGYRVGVGNRVVNDEIGVIFTPANHEPVLAEFVQPEIDGVVMRLEIGDTGCWRRGGG